MPAELFNLSYHLWKETSLAQQILQNALFSDISCASDNIGLTLFCQYTSSFVLQHTPGSAPTLSVRHGATLYESCYEATILLFCQIKTGEQKKYHFQFSRVGATTLSTVCISHKAKYLSLHTSIIVVNPSLHLRHLVR